MKTFFTMLTIVIVVVSVSGVLIFRQYSDRIVEVVENNLPDDELDAVDAYVNTASDGYTWYRDSQNHYQLVVFDKPLELAFSSTEAQSLKEQSLDAGYELAINASYFLGSYVESTHAGLLQIRGEQHSDYVPNVQISHVVVIDHLVDEIQIHRALTFDPTNFRSNTYSLMQTGPLILESNHIQTEFIEKSLNGTEETLRTIMGVTESGKKFFLITKMQIDLSSLAELILEIPPLQDEVITAINLDGGSSTAMYSKITPSFSFRTGVRLPLVLGVK